MEGRVGDRRTRPPDRRAGNSPYRFQDRDNDRGRDETRDNRGEYYRPGDFSFRASGPRGRPPPRFPQAPPSGPRHQSANYQSKNAPHQPNSRASNPRGRREINKKSRTRSNRGPNTSNRPLLRSERAPTPEQLASMRREVSRFKSLADISDSDGEDMQLDSDIDVHGIDDDGNTSTERPRKRRQLDSTIAEDKIESEQAVSVIPKWSNPDPYTSLPPPDETGEKRKDFVKLIRKAKQATLDSETAGGEGDDFISLDFEQPKDNSALPSSIVKPIHLNNVDSRHDLVDTLGPPPLPSQEVQEALEAIDTWPPPPSIHGSKSDDKGLKRSREEHVTDDISKPGKPRKGQPLALEWNPKHTDKPLPWFQSDHSECESIGIRLHKEICDFHEYVRPREFEKLVRKDLIRRITAFVTKQWRGAQVHVFGSFAAELYLPNADMDIVIIAPKDQSGQTTDLSNPKSAVHHFTDRLIKSGLAKRRSIATISKARVPLVKFVDGVTGIRCDVSFNNLSGVVALETYQEWAAQYPALSVLLPLIKHFLLMRNLNEVHTGGLGSFAVTCLLVNLMNQMPHVASGNMNPMHNLGEVFMNFLDYYGNKFNIQLTGIQMNPISLFSIPGSRYQRKESSPRLCIIDPNKSDNDISSGSSNIRTVLVTFSEAFSVLRSRMADLRYQRSASESEKDDGSILGPLFAGNYHAFETQRERIYKVYQNWGNQRS